MFTRKQHYYPRCLLKHFANENKMIVKLCLCRQYIVWHIVSLQESSQFLVIHKKSHILAHKCPESCKVPCV